MRVGESALVQDPMCGIVNLAKRWLPKELSYPLNITSLVAESEEELKQLFVWRGYIFHLKAAKMSTVPRYASIQSLLDEILNIQSNSNKDSDTVRRIGEIIKESNELIKDSKVPGEVVLDARILQTGSQIVNSNITSMDTNLSDFNEEEYVAGIKGILEENMDYDDGEEDDDESFGNKWRCFAPMMYHLYHKSDPPVFMLGSLSFDPPPPAEVRPKTDRVIKKMNEAKTQLTQASGNGQEEKRPEENMCEHILKSLVGHMELNGNEPLEFIRFIVNPDSYWETIQNIFYFSFLVRDGRVGLIHNDRGLPIILYPCEDPAGDSECTEKKMNHFSFSLGMKDWRACIERFNITTPMIKPLKQNK